MIASGPGPLSYWRRLLRKIVHVPGWSPEALGCIAVFGAAALGSYVFRALAEIEPHPVDFSIFYASTRAWLADTPMYCSDCEAGLGLNYNPPHLHLMLLPLARLPLHWAFALWTAGSLAAGAVTIRVAMREVAERWPAQDLRILAAAALTCAGVAATIRMGQVSLYLALVVTLAWKAGRHGKWGIEGLCLGLAISLKPFLLLMAPLLLLRKQGRAMAVALLTATVCLSAGAIVFGRAQFEGWIALLRRPAPVEHLQFFLNGSWSGFVARGHLWPAAATAGSVAVAALTLAAARKGSEDRAWLLGISGALLASPLGWIYYVPLMAGPLAALAHAHRLPRWTWSLWPLFVFPPIVRELLQDSRVGALTLGSAYFWLFTGIWVAAACAIPADRSGAVRQ